MLVDSHCHFDFIEFDMKREQIWQSCRENGVFSLVIPGVSVDQWAQLSQLVHHNPRLFFGVGLHPWYLTASANATTQTSYLRNMEERLIDASQHDKCVAIGECGLDRTIDLDMAYQLEVLRLHIDVSNATKKPLILHSVKSHSDILHILKKHPAHYGGIVHGYSGSIAMALAFWQRGFCLGIGGTITYPRATKTRECVKKLPIESIVLETDAPSMPLHGRQGQPNSPEYLVDIAREVSALRKESMTSVAAHTTKNVTTLFPAMRSLECL